MKIQWLLWEILTAKCQENYQNYSYHIFFFLVRIKWVLTLKLCPCVVVVVVGVKSYNFHDSLKTRFLAIKCTLFYASTLFIHICMSVVLFVLMDNFLLSCLKTRKKKIIFSLFFKNCFCNYLKHFLWFETYVTLPRVMKNYNW